MYNYIYKQSPRSEPVNGDYVDNRLTLKYKINQVVGQLSFFQIHLFSVLKSNCREYNEYITIERLPFDCGTIL